MCSFFTASGSLRVLAFYLVIVERSSCESNDEFRTGYESKFFVQFRYEERRNWTIGTYWKLAYLPRYAPLRFVSTLGVLFEEKRRSIFLSRSSFWPKYLSYFYCVVSLFVSRIKRNEINRFYRVDTSWIYGSRSRGRKWHPRRIKSLQRLRNFLISLR